MKIYDKARKGRQWLILGVLGLFLMSTTGCISLNPFKSRPAIKKKYNRERIKERVPVQMEKGKIAYYYKKSDKVSSEKTTPKLTFMQRIGRFIGALGLGWLVLFFVSPPIALLIKRFVFDRMKTMKNVIKETVKGIKNSKLIELNSELHNSLASSHSDKTKEYISKIKTGL